MNDDYYTIMQDRIRYFSKKYDPLNRYPVEWEKERNTSGYPKLENEKPDKRNHIKRKLNKVMETVLPFLF